MTATFLHVSFAVYLWINMVYNGVYIKLKEKKTARVANNQDLM
jgi:hypothetical protein